METLYTLPSDLNAERGFLAYLILQGSDVLLEYPVEESYFHGTETREVWTACKKIIDDERPVNISTLGSVIGFERASMACMSWNAWAPQHSHKILKQRDADRKTAEKSIMICNAICAGSKSADDIEVKAMINSMLDEQIESDIVTVEEAEVMREASVANRIAIRESGKKYTGDETGFEFLDNLLDGIQPASYMVVVGQSSAGKSAFINNMTAELLEQGKKIEMMTFEMPPEIYNTRLLSIMSGVDYFKIDRGLDITAAEQFALDDAVEKLKKAKFRYRIDNAYYSIIRNLKRLESSDTDYVFIDYLQNLDTPEDISKEYSAYKKLSLAIRSFTRRTRKTVVLVSQMSNENINSIKKSESQAKGAGDVKAHSTHFIELSNYFEKERTKDILASTGMRPLMVSLDKSQTGMTGVGYFKYRGANYKFIPATEQQLKDMDKPLNSSINSITQPILKRQ